MSRVCWSILASALCAAAANDFPPKGMLRTAQRRTLALNGEARHYLIQPIDGAGRFPVVILLHGGTQTAEFVWMQSSLPTLGAREHFIVVAPEGAGKHWNDGRGSTIAGDPASSADDVGFLHALIREVIQHNHGDANAIFMAGASNGGFMTMHFACSSNAVDLRAAASFIAGLPTREAANCPSTKPLPWLAVNGTADPIIPFEGQPEGARRRGKPQPGLLSANETFAFWANRARCGQEVKSERVPKRNPGDDSSWAERRMREGCVGGFTSAQYVLHGSGHTWPNTRPGPVVKLLGGSSQDLDAGEMMWDFFRSTLARH